jgi:hypothetical protein
LTPSSALTMMVLRLVLTLLELLLLLLWLDD